MGVFDSLIVECPHCCAETEVQSKSGECIMGRYSLDNVPLSVMYGLEDKICRCDECEGPFTFDFTACKVCGSRGIISAELRRLDD